MSRFAQCADCAFEHVEPAICNECRDADQFQESDNDSDNAVPLYYHDWKETL